MGDWNLAGENRGYVIGKPIIGKSHNLVAKFQFNKLIKKLDLLNLDGKKESPLTVELH